MSTQSRPIFVLGPKLSGSELLALSLGQHRHISMLLDDTFISSLVAQLGAAYLSIEPKNPLSPVGFAGITRGQFLQYFADPVDNLVRRVIASPFADGDGLISAEDEQHLREERRRSPRRWVDSAPDNAHVIQGLYEIFPLAKFIYVVRDPEEVVTLLPNTRAPDRSRYKPDTAFAHWRDTTAFCVAAGQALGPDTVLRVHYDDLVTSPAESVQHCLAFVGEPYDDACLRPFRGLASSATRTRRDQAVAVSFQASNHGGLPFDGDTGIMGVDSSDANGGTAKLENAFLEFVRVRAGRSRPSRLSQADRVRKVARLALPADATVLVVSRGDEDLLDLAGRSGWHFPQDRYGEYAGYHPANSDEAIVHLEELRSKGAGYLLFPKTAFWWLDFYEGLRRHLEGQYQLVWHDEHCILYRLTSLPPVSPSSADSTSVPAA